VIALVQRVSQASVAVTATGYHAATGHGLCILLGVRDDDTDAEAKWIASKIAHLRIFRDDEGRMNRSVQDVSGEILLVSQFTLLGDCRRGHRPSYSKAASPELGERLYEHVAELLRDEHHLIVKTGVFGAMMDVSLTNDGPVTLIVELTGNRSADG